MANVIKHKRGSGSDPVANDLVIGEVAIRTDVGKLFTKMDNGSVAEIAGGGSDIAINTLSSSSGTGGGSATFNGSAFRFTLSAPPSVSAQQLLVSINGVIQKPVPGTGQPSEGFSVDGTDIILGAAPATGSDFFILTFKSLGVSEPADNSVTSAKIADGAIVNADINASAAIAGSKISPTFTSDLTVEHSGSPTILIHDTSADNQCRIQFQTDSRSWSCGLHGGEDRWKVSKSDTFGTNDYLEVDNGGSLHISNNIVVGGTVDGRDIATDGSKLDGIESGATADQTASEIKTLFNSSGLVNAQIDASAAIDGSKINPTFSSGQTITVSSNGTNPVLKVQGGGPNFITFASDGSGTVNSDSINLVYRTGPNTLAFERASDDAVLFSVDADNGAIIGAGNLTIDTNTLHVDASNNRVGIGTTSPSGGELHVVGSGNTGIKVQVGSSSADQIYLGNTGGASSVGTLTNVGFNLIQNGGVALAIDTSKNVLIGTTTKGANGADELTIGTSGDTGMTIRSGSSSAGNIFFSDGTSGADESRGIVRYFHNTNAMVFNTDNAERMRIDTNGKVGIGTASPSHALHVVSNGTDTAFFKGRIIRFDGAAASDSPRLNFSLDGTDKAQILLHRTDDSLDITTLTAKAIKFKINSVEKMRIDSSGNVGIGKTSPNIGSHSRTLTVSNTGTSARSAIEIEGNTANAHGVLEFYNNGTLVSGLHSRGSDRLQFVTGSSGTVRGQFTSNGLNFGSDTAAANALDDYEEGTWTPNIRNSGTTSTWSSQQGKYVKIGQQVTCWFNADGGTNPRSGGAGTSLIMTGLPFNISMFGNPIQGIVGANDVSQNGLYSTSGLILNVFGQGTGGVRFGSGGQAINKAISYAAGCFTYTAA